MKYESQNEILNATQAELYALSKEEFIAMEYWAQDDVLSALEPVVYKAKKGEQYITITEFKSFYVQVTHKLEDCDYDRELRKRFAVVNLEVFERLYYLN